MTKRHWLETSGTAGDVYTDWSREFRGSGRARYMMRDLEAGPDPLDPTFERDVASAVWTDYANDWPTGDYTVSDAEYAPQTELDRYTLGLAQVDASDNVAYFHWNQIGSTTAMTAANGTQVARMTYTAFGEPVYADGSFATRYHYAGAWGYETFDTDPASETYLPFQHVGHRWYDPATGRFVQRDPIGIRGGLNIYEYVSSRPLTTTDPLGLAPINDNLFALIPDPSPAPSPSPSAGGESGGSGGGGGDWAQNALGWEGPGMRGGNPIPLPNNVDDWSSFVDFLSSCKGVIEWGADLFFLLRGRRLPLLPPADPTVPLPPLDDDGWTRHDAGTSMDSKVINRMQNSSLASEDGPNLPRPAWNTCWGHDQDRETNHTDKLLRDSA